MRISLVNLLNLEIDSRKFGAFAIGDQANSLRFGFFYQQDGGDRGWTLQLLLQKRSGIGKVLTFLAMAEPHNLGLQLPIPLVLSQYYELRVLFPYPRLIPIFAGENCQTCPCYILLSCLNQRCFLKNDPLLWCRTFPHAVVPFGSGAWNSHLRIHGPWARQWGSPSSKSTGPSMFPSFLPLVP